MITSVDWSQIEADCGVVCIEPKQIGEGWGSVVFRVNPHQVLKLAKRAGMYGELHREAHVLRAIDGQLPIKTPRPDLEMKHSRIWPHGYTVQEYVAGVSLNRSSVRGTSIAQVLGTTLRALHAIPVSGDLRTQLPELDFQKESRAFLDSSLEAVRRRIGADVCHFLRTESMRVLNDVDYFDFGPTLIHCDLHGDNLLLDDAGNIGLIDWGDAGMGDPDTDFLPLYQEFGIAFLRSCANAYGHSNIDQLGRKLRDLDLISLLHDVVYAPEYGTAEDEADSWDGLSRWMGE